ncbi:hypothetical protein D3C74_132740 [compost metagenome]
MIDARTSPLVVDLTNYYNNKGVSWASLEIWASLEHSGLSLPGECLPNDEIVKCVQVPFYFPKTNMVDHDHMICEGQTITLDKVDQEYSYLYFLGFSTWGDYKEIVTLIYDDFEEKSMIGLSFMNRLHWDEKLVFLEEEIGITIPNCIDGNHNPLMISTGIWVNKISLSRHKLRKIKLSDNPYMHIFAMTLI